MTNLKVLHRAMFDYRFGQSAIERAVALCAVKFFLSSRDAQLKRLADRFVKSLRKAG